MSRETVLGNIRRSIAAVDDPARQETVLSRLMGAPQGIIPARAQLGREARLQLFIDRARYAAASVERVADSAAVPAAVADYLRSRNLPAKLRMSNDRRIKAMPWAEQRALQIRHGPSDGSDEVGLSHAANGIAETGTLVLYSGRDNPTTLNFLPDHHLVVLEASDVVGDLEAVMQLTRERYGKGQMPRTLNFITGPSRSGDIEQTLLLGAHGPRALHIIIVGE